MVWNNSNSISRHFILGPLRFTRSKSAANWKINPQNKKRRDKAESKKWRPQPKNVVRIKVCARDTNTCVYMCTCVYMYWWICVCTRVGSLNLLHRQKVNGIPQQERAARVGEPESRLIYYVCMHVCVCMCNRFAALKIEKLMQNLVK